MDYFLVEGIQSEKCLELLSTSDNENKNIFSEIKNKEKWWMKNCLSFVGIYKTKDDDFLYCVPKYMVDINRVETDYFNKNKNEIISKMNIIVKVIEKLRNEGRNVENGDNEFAPDEYREKDSVDDKSIAETLLADYFRNGIYAIETYYENNSSKGRIKWNKTIEKNYPIISRNSVIYTKCRARKRVLDDSNLFTRIYLTILKQCSAKRKLHGDTYNIDIPYFTEISCDDLKSYIPLLQSRLNHIFENREKMILKAMISWIEDSPYYKTYVGTTCFQNVWEWVNDSVFGNMDDHNSTEPIYHLFSNDYVAKGIVKPDTLYLRMNDEQKKMMVKIYDAKYYVPKRIYDDNGSTFIEGMPASADIAKQIAYEYFIRQAGETLKSQNLEITIEYSNEFLIPMINSERIQMFAHRNDKWENELYRKIGYARIGEFKAIFGYMSNYLENKTLIENVYRENSFLEVGVTEVNVDKLYEMYLKNQKNANI